MIEKLENGKVYCTDGRRDVLLNGRLLGMDDYRVEDAHARQRLQAIRDSERVQAEAQAAYDRAWSHESAETPFIRGLDY